MFQGHDEHCDECHDKNRFECVFEFKCVFESRFEGCFEYGFDCVYTQSESTVLWVTKIRLRPSTSGAWTTGIAKGCTYRLPTTVFVALKEVCGRLDEQQDAINSEFVLSGGLDGGLDSSEENQG